MINLRINIPGKNFLQSFFGSTLLIDPKDYLNLNSSFFLLFDIR